MKVTAYKPVMHRFRVVVALLELTDWTLDSKLASGPQYPNGLMIMYGFHKGLPRFFLKGFSMFASL